MTKLIMKFLVMGYAFALGSCAPTVKPLLGNYSDKPFQSISDKSFDEVWSNIIDLFATKGISIKIIDKSSGLIVSEKHSLIDRYTFEGYNGQKEPVPGLLPTPRDPEAWVVVSTVVTDKEQRPTEISGEWNVRIKNIENGKTSINVNLVNLKAFVSVYQPMDGRTYTNELQVKSTGKFEQSIAEIIK